MMRYYLFEAIKEKINEIAPEIGHIELWNHNVEFIEQEEGWSCPAIFVEIGPITWRDYQGNSQRGEGEVSIHLVTDWSEGGHYAAFALSERVVKALDGLCGQNFNGFALLRSITNHNHEDILETIDSFAVRYLRS